jgi:hypothetical protein
MNSTGLVYYRVVLAARVKMCAAELCSARGGSRGWADPADFMAGRVVPNAVSPEVIKVLNDAVDANSEHRPDLVIASRTYRCVPDSTGVTLVAGHWFREITFVGLV